MTLDHHKQRLVQSVAGLVKYPMGVFALLAA